jgi:hypothetical protein
VIDRAEPRYKKVFPSLASFTITGAIAGLVIMIIILIVKNNVASTKE